MRALPDMTFDGEILHLADPWPCDDSYYVHEGSGSECDLCSGVGSGQ